MYQPAFPQYAQPYGTMQYQQPAMPPQQQPMQQPRGISGRVVGAPSEIVPNEVPMDGTVAFFPTQDGSAVFAKAWNPDGTISTVQYAPVQQQQQEDAAAPTIADVLSRLDDLEDVLNGINQTPAKTTRRTAQKGAKDDAE